MKIRITFFSVLFLALFLSGVCLAKDAEKVENAGIGISLKQVTRYFASYISVKKMPADHDQSHFMGRSADKTAILDVVGNPKNVSESTLIVGLPKDAKETVQRNGAMLLRLMLNVAPDWDGGARWMTDALHQVTTTSNTTVIAIHGNKRFSMTFFKSQDEIMLDVKHT